MRPNVRKLVFWLGAVLAAFVLVALGPWLYTEAAWFREVGHPGVFWRTLALRWVTGLSGAVVLGGIVYANLAFALRATEPTQVRPVRGVSTFVWRSVRWGARAAALGLAVLFGIASSGYWLELQMMIETMPVGEVDPAFGHDLGFYLLQLPALGAIRGALVVAVWMGVAGSALVYFATTRGAVRPLFWQATRHAGVLAAVLLLLAGAGHLLDRYDLLFGGHGAVAGAGYADLHARAPTARIAAAVAWVAAIACGYAAWTLRARVALVAVAAYLVFVVAGTWIYPTAVQQFSVEPNELAREKPYLRRAIAGTRKAYGLDRIATQRMDVQNVPTPESVAAARPTLENVRLWDWRPLLSTYGQIQLIRSYYELHDVDIDRYWLGDGPRQLMLSVRELAHDKLPDNARTWVNLHLKYTHGYGLVASPVNRVTSEGLPELWVKDIPPVTEVPELTVRQPAVYFGERLDAYAIVGTSTSEFDYPAGDSNKTTRYTGRGGAPLGGRLSRLAWSMRLGAVQIVLSSYLRPESRVLIHRTVAERVATLCPLVRYDRDAYPVLIDGRIQWVMDGYTVARTYPYSEPDAEGFNYVRNSVKAVVDAFDGTVTLYVADPDDPILAAYRRIFPGLFTPLARMPEGLRRHLRYPVDLFRVQVGKYAAYHMTDPEVLYNREDLWQVPDEASGDERKPMEPYYVTMQLPDADEPEFLLMLPLVPARRDNMVAWIAARNDEPRRGQLVEYRFPKERLVYGPMQIEARIDQDPRVSQQLTLWDQRGSQVVRGPLLVVPIGEAETASFLYVEPVYLQAERGRIPELKRVIVALGERIEMAPTLEQAVAAALGVPPERIVPGDETPAETVSREATTPTASPPSADEDPGRRALRHLQEAKERLAKGDWAGYGTEMAEVERALQELARPPPR